MSIGYSSWSGWGFGFGWSSGWWNAPIYTPVYTGWRPVYVAPVVYTAPVIYTTPVVYSNPVVYTEPAVYVPPVVMAPEVIARYELEQTATPAVLPTSLDMTAWSALNASEAARAEQAFADLLAADPSDARAYAGWGIAAMLQGNTDDAAAAFRAAIDTDANALRGLPVAAALTERIRLHAGALRTRNDANAVFVSSVGYTLVGERDLAARSIARAIELGGDPAVMTHLHSKLIYAMAGAL